MNIFRIIKLNRKTIPMNNQNDIPEIVSINQLCALMGISRSRYYQILNEKLILPPIYSPDSKRPYYTKEMALRNLQVKRDSTGVNGKICLFYNTRKPTMTMVLKPKTKKSKSNNSNSANQHRDLIEGLELLGLENVKPSQIEAAIKKSFPDGAGNISEGELLKSVYCLIKAQNSTDNVNR